MSEIAGARGSNRRTLLLCGAVAVGVVVMLLAGFMAEASVKQVYWAVYSRLHPMRDSAEAQGFSIGQGSSFGESRQTMNLKADLKRNAAEQAIKAGEKEEVRLVQTGTDKIKHRDDEKKAASEAKTRQSDTESLRENEQVENLAEELSAKATAAFATEIQAVAGSKEAERLTDGLQRDPNPNQTQLEKEAGKAAAKSSKVKKHTREKGSTLAQQGQAFVMRL